MGPLPLRLVDAAVHAPVTTHDLAIAITAATTGDSGSLTLPLIVFGGLTAIGGFLTGLAAFITAWSNRNRGRYEDDDPPRRRRRSTR